jgi:chemotaxis protein CheX
MSSLSDDIQRALLKTAAHLLDTMIPMHYDIENKGEVTMSSDVVSLYLMGNIKVTGRLIGSLSVSIPHSLALDMTARMLDEPIENVGDDVYETVAEIINIIAGGVKSALSAESEIFQLGLPQVLELEQAPLQFFNNPYRLHVPIRTESGEFVLFSTLHEAQ